MALAFPLKDIKGDEFLPLLQTLFRTKMQQCLSLAFEKPGELVKTISIDNMPDSSASHFFFNGVDPATVNWEVEMENGKEKSICVFNDWVTVRKFFSAPERAGCFLPARVKVEDGDNHFHFIMPYGRMERLSPDDFLYKDNEKQIIALGFQKFVRFKDVSLFSNWRVHGPQGSLNMPVVFIIEHLKGEINGLPYHLTRCFVPDEEGPLFDFGFGIEVKGFEVISPSKAVLFWSNTINFTIQKIACPERFSNFKVLFKLFSCRNGVVGKRKNDDDDGEVPDLQLPECVRDHLIREYKISNIDWQDDDAVGKGLLCGRIIIFYDKAEDRWGLFNISMHSKNRSFQHEVSHSMTKMHGTKDERVLNYLALDCEKDVGTCGLFIQAENEILGEQQSGEELQDGSWVEVVRRVATSTILPEHQHLIGTELEKVGEKRKLNHNNGAADDGL